MLASAAGLTIAAASSAAAASCTAKVTISGPSHGHLVLSPSSVKVQVGNCVEYVNSATSKVTLTISQGSRTVFGPRDIAKGSATSFTPSSAGRDTVSASSQVLLLKFTGGGSVTATAPSSPHPTKSGSPKPTPKTSKSPSKHPNVAPNPKHPHKQANKNGKSQKKQTPQPHATGIKLPPLPPLPSVGVTALPKGSKPLVAPGETVPPAVAQPGTNSTSPVAAVLSGPIEPLDSNRRGLPVAVGVLVVLGIATGWGRVLLAASGPGDKRSKGDHKI
jgi:plastocyanin